jgi:hypothetical protein
MRQRGTGWVCACGQLNAPLVTECCKCSNAQNEVAKMTQAAAQAAADISTGLSNAASAGTVDPILNNPLVLGGLLLIVAMLWKILAGIWVFLIPVALMMRSTCPVRPPRNIPALPWASKSRNSPSKPSI